MSDLVFREMACYGATQYVDIDLCHNERVIALGYLSKRKGAETWNLNFGFGKGSETAFYTDTRVSDLRAAQAFASGAYMMACRFGADALQ